MMKRIPLRAAVILLSFALIAVTAAPLLPSRPALADDVRSMADLERVVLEIVTMPPPLREAGIVAAHIRKRWRVKLAEAGIEVVEYDAPTLRLQVQHLVDEDVPDAAGLLALLTLSQEVSITRLDERLTLPSYTAYAAGIDAGDQIGPSFRPAILGMVDSFIAKVRQATDDRAKRAQSGRQP